MSPYLQANKLAKQFHEYWQKTLGSETKDFILHHIASSMSFHIPFGSTNPCPQTLTTYQDYIPLGKAQVHAVGLCQSWENLKFKKY